MPVIEGIPIGRTEEVSNAQGSQSQSFAAVFIPSEEKRNLNLTESMTSIEI